ncbi:MAG: hypothetical protein GY701_28890 [Sulfitobacter sp.]|nr:hypothetical protein [Sulfitobacter sp.]
MKIVSYATPDYREHSDRLLKSCAESGYDCTVFYIEDRGSWLRNTNYKGEFMAEKVLESAEPVLWLDADAVVARKLTLFEDAEKHFDFAALIGPREIRSGTVWFNTTDAAKSLVQAWAESCPKNLRQWDQHHLTRVWNTARKSIRTLSLPLSYCQRFDEPGNHPNPHIIHYQASRKRRANEAKRTRR